MEKIKREEWISVADRLPSDGMICLVTDGEDVGLARADRTFDPPGVYWDAEGVQGVDLEWTIDKPTHWIALSVELPSQREGDGGSE